MKRNYETAFILNPVLDESGTEQEIAKIEEVVGREGGVVKEWDKWGKRRMSFPIKRQSEGYYAFLRFEAEPASIERLTETFKLDDNILRHMHIVLDD
ncbi:MAG: 30S ribosomal protein S6 [Candidatus Eisenbacteria bacterium]|nr:30S ribosomal protein S6 [Candidatus Eisenbacteria bacterium]